MQYPHQYWSNCGLRSIQWFLPGHWACVRPIRTVNNHKRDRLPSREIVRKRSEWIVENWRNLSREFPSRFLNAAAELSDGAVTVRNKEGERRAGEVTGDPTAGAIELAPGWEKPLLSSFVEAIECTAVKRRAAGPFPTVIGTLDAIHLASAILWGEVESGSDIRILTHDKQLALCAHSLGIRVNLIDDSALSSSIWSTDPLISSSPYHTLD